MPRLLKRYKEFEESGQVPPSLIEPDFSVDFVVALQRAVRDTPGVLKQFGATLNGLIRCLQNTFTGNQRGSTVGLHATTSMLTLAQLPLLATLGRGGGAADVQTVGVLGAEMPATTWTAACMQATRVHAKLVHVCCTVLQGTSRQL